MGKATGSESFDFSGPPKPPQRTPFPEPGPAESARLAILIGLFLFGLPAAGLGLLLSQYYPVFGGVIEKAAARPWSPVRETLILIHMLVFGLGGAVLGAGLLYLSSAVARERRARRK